MKRALAAMASLLVACGAPARTATTTVTVAATATATSAADATLPAQSLTFDVTYEEGVLHVVGVLPAGAHVATDDATDAWVSHFEPAPSAVVDGERVVAACGAALCTVRYDFALRDCARSVKDPETAAEHDGTIVAPSSSFLVLPHDDDGYPAHRFRMHSAASRFASGAPLVEGFYRQGKTDLTMPVVRLRGR